MHLSRCPYIDNTMFDCEPATSARSEEELSGPAEAAAADGAAADEDDTLDDVDVGSPVGTTGLRRLCTVDDVGSPTGSMRLRRLSAASASEEMPASASEEMPADDKASGAVTPVMTYADPVKGPPPSPSASWRSPVGDVRDAPLEANLLSRRRKGGRQKRSLSFNSVREWIKEVPQHVPQSPELCGVQAILPRRCGLSVQAKLGEGSFGKVVLALNNTNHSGAACGRLGKATRIIHKMPKAGVKVVLKCVKKVDTEVAGTTESECLEREVLIHGRVDHINIPRMYGYYEDEQHLTMILDLVNGEELKQVLVMKRTLPEEECRLICLQVARGLQHLHDMRVVHRDVSPRNILLGQGNKAWLIDLGLAVDLDAQDAGSIEMAGTIGYMPPEAQASGSLSTVWDMWALGTILYEMMFGFSPFLPHELHMPTALVQFPDPAWGLHSSEELKDVLTALLAKDPAQRLSSGGLLSHKWSSSDVLAALDAMFAPEIAERVAQIETDEEQGGQQQLLAVDLLSSQKYHGAKVAATLLPRTASIDEEIADAMDEDCQSLTSLWSAVSSSSAARWDAVASNSPGISRIYSPSRCGTAAGQPPSPLGLKAADATTPISVPTFGSLGLMRRSSSETELPELSVPY